MPAVLLSVKEILLEIGFIEKMRTTYGNKKVYQTLFHYSHYAKAAKLIGGIELENSFD